MQKVEEMFTFTFSWTVYLLCYQWKRWWNRIRWRTPVAGETLTAYAYCCPPLQRNGGAVAARNLAAHRSQETPVQADTRWERNQESMASRLSEETARAGGSQKRKKWASVRGDHRARRARDQERPSGKLSSRGACCFSWSWSWWFRRYQSSDKLSFGRGNVWKLTAAQRSFRTGVQVDKRPGAHGYPLLWRAAVDNSRNWMSKQSPEKRTHRSLSHERWNTDDTDILFSGGNTRTLASHSWAVLFQ